jgi:purine nucleosidase
MSRPVLIDTDIGVDDAVAITLALCVRELELVGLVSVGGNVPLDQVTRNIPSLLAALGRENWPQIGKGLDQDPSLSHALDVHGDDGLGGLGLPTPVDFSAGDYIDTYEELIERHGGDLAIIAIGPLTNLAALMDQRPGLLERAGQIVIMGGAIWCAGNITPKAEFNFYRDPTAASKVLGSGLPISLVSLDITTQVAMDESHLAHLSAGGTKSGQLLSQMIRHPLEADTDGGPGRFIVHDALAVGLLIWPHLFLRSRMGIEMTTRGDDAGQSRPVLAKDKTRQVAVAMSVNAGEFLENLLESLCDEQFIV